MPEEISTTVESSPTPAKEQSLDWVKVLLISISVVGFVLLAASAYAGYWYGRESAKIRVQRAEPQTKTQNQQTAQTTTQPTTPPTSTPTPTVEDEAIVYDLTLEPAKDWVSKNICDVGFKISPKFKNTLQDQPQEIEKTCLFGYNYKDLVPGQLIPITFNVYVYKDYDGSSRRQFYFSKRFPGKPIEDLGAFRYTGSQEFKAGELDGLVLEFEDADPGDSISGFKAYLVGINRTKLVAVEASLESDVLKMFLTGIER